jgi:hypothetical protein
LNIRAFFLQMVFGAAGGYVAGCGFTPLSWGARGDLLIGLAGGAVGGQILHHFWGGQAFASETEILLSGIIGGCVGGALMLVLLGLLKAILKRH